MKASNATSAKATPPAPRSGQSSARPRPTLTSADEFSLSGPSDSPDRAFNAYRKDLADVALAGRVIASHYAEPLERVIRTATELRAEPSEDAEIVAQLKTGDAFAMLDDSVGWAWGYAGADRRVGYLKSEAVGPA